MSFGGALNSITSFSGRIQMPHTSGLSPHLLAILISVYIEVWKEGILRLILRWVLERDISLSNFQRRPQNSLPTHRLLLFPFECLKECLRRRHLTLALLKFVQAVAILFKFISNFRVIDILFFLDNHLQEATRPRHTLPLSLRWSNPLLLNLTLHFIVGHLKLTLQPLGDGAGATKAVVTT